MPIIPHVYIIRTFSSSLATNFMGIISGANLFSNITELQGCKSQKPGILDSKWIPRLFPDRCVHAGRQQLISWEYTNALDKISTISISFWWSFRAFLTPTFLRAEIWGELRNAYKKKQCWGSVGRQGLYTEKMSSSHFFRKVLFTPRRRHSRIFQPVVCFRDYSLLDRSSDLVIVFFTCCFLPIWGYTVHSLTNWTRNLPHWNLHRSVEVWTPSNPRALGAKFTQQSQNRTMTSHCWSNKMSSLTCSVVCVVFVSFFARGFIFFNRF